MSAIRWRARRRDARRIIKFEGCYHGHSDGLLVKAGSGIATLGIPGSAGVPEEIAQLTLALPFNDFVAVEAAFDAHPDEIAAVILEPVVGNAGCIPPAPVVTSTGPAPNSPADNGALLIVDEVMTGFRLALGGACELYGLDPDLVTLGKIVGGGLPVGAFGGKTQLHGVAGSPRSRLPGRNVERKSAGNGRGTGNCRLSSDHAAEVYPQLEAVSKPSQTVSLRKLRPLACRSR